MSTQIDHEDLFIGGAFVAASSSARFTAINPATEQVIGTVPQGNAADVDRAVTAARAAFEQWSQTAGSERGDALTRLADAFAKRADDFVALVSRQNGAQSPPPTERNRRILRSLRRNRR